MSHLHLDNVAKEDPVVSEDKATVSLEEADLVEVASNAVHALHALPFLTAVRRLKQAAAAAAGVADAVLQGVANVQEPVTAGLDVHGAEVTGVRQAVHVGDKEAAAAVREPDLVRGVPAHGLHAASGGAVVGQPIALARGPGHVEVSTGGHSHVLALGGALYGGEVALVIRGATDSARDGPVEGGVNGLLDPSRPVVAGVAGGVDGALVGDHLSLAGLARESRDEQRGAGELGAQRNPVPGRAPVLGVQEDGRLANNPPLLAAEANGLEAVVDALVLCLGDFAALPCLACILCLQESLAGSENEAVGGVIFLEGNVQEHGALAHREVDGLPVRGHGGGTRDVHRGEIQQRRRGDGGSTSVDETPAREGHSCLLGCGGIAPDGRAGCRGCAKGPEGLLGRQGGARRRLGRELRGAEGHSCRSHFQRVLLGIDPKGISSIFVDDVLQDVAADGLSPDPIGPSTRALCGADATSADHPHHRRRGCTGALLSTFYVLLDRKRMAEYIVDNFCVEDLRILAIDHSSPARPVDSWQKYYMSWMKVLIRPYGT